MAAKVIAQLVVNGVTIFSKAFFSAYQQALRNAKAGGAPNAVNQIIKHHLRADEAYKIMDIEKEDLNRKTLDEKFKKLFEANNPDKGGSFYLQSKVFRSKEVLDAELMGSTKPEENTENKDG